ncbi:C-type lectin domain family 2 member B-like isoform X2 [Struthio camelus]|uniref:C-type lectin domain family 2 member B-like isoform X2 n=1 Tax=Struthio camelus TaxID=8801 RepID=UPI00051E2507|nr:PREDICTED: C-type lectin domain family 2 member B-like isoform X2 [Struthio camelus australis]
MEPEDEQKAETTQIAGNAGPIKAVLIQRHRNALQALRQQLLRHFKELRIRRCCNRWICLLITKVVYEDLPSEQCPSEWIGYRKKCYFISEEEQNWTASQTFCAKNRSVLAVFENQEEMHSLAKRLKMEDSWIGLRKKGESFCWENDIALEVDLFQIQNHSECAYLESFTISTSACSLPRRWICVRSSLK